LRSRRLSTPGCRESITARRIASSDSRWRRLRPIGHSIFQGKQWTPAQITQMTGIHLLCLWFGAR
jgi:hypothetical protein